MEHSQITRALDREVRGLDADQRHVLALIHLNVVLQAGSEELVPEGPFPDHAVQEVGRPSHTATEEDGVRLEGQLYQAQVLAQPRAVLAEHGQRERVFGLVDQRLGDDGAEILPAFQGGSDVHRHGQVGRHDDTHQALEAAGAAEVGLVRFTGDLRLGVLDFAGEGLHVSRVVPVLQVQRGADAGADLDQQALAVRRGALGVQARVLGQHGQVQLVELAQAHCCSRHVVVVDGGHAERHLGVDARDLLVRELRNVGQDDTAGRLLHWTGEEQPGHIRLGAETLPALLAAVHQQLQQAGVARGGHNPVAYLPTAEVVNLAVRVGAADAAGEHAALDPIGIHRKTLPWGCLRGNRREATSGLQSAIL